MGNRQLTSTDASFRPPARIHSIDLHGPDADAWLSALCERIRAILDRDPGARVDCDLAPLGRADLETVNALARLQLTARRGGSHISVRHAPEGLSDLLALLGLDSCVAIRVETGGQSEEREEPRGVEEEGDLADPTA